MYLKLNKTMKILFLIFSVAFVVNGLTDHEQWHNYKNSYGKSYNNIVEEKVRFQIFKDNVKKIQEHNEKYKNGESSYTMGINKFADLTSTEFSEMLLRKVPSRPKVEANTQKFTKNLHVPEKFDWREKGNVVSAVRDQGICGACWAFSAVEVIESHNVIQNNISVILSPQELIDCSGLYGNGGCYGGMPIFAHEYIAAHGIESESDYPYKGLDGKCTKQSNKTVLKIKGHKAISPTEEDLKNAIGTIGPMSVAIYAEPIQLYESGIFDDKTCQNNKVMLDHAVLAVGYGSEEKTDYWTVQNSWGADWGEKGFFRIQRNESLCGILLDISYAIL